MPNVKIPNEVPVRCGAQTVIVLSSLDTRKQKHPKNLCNAKFLILSERLRKMKEKHPIELSPLCSANFSNVTNLSETLPMSMYSLQKVSRHMNQSMPNVSRQMM